MPKFLCFAYKIINLHPNIMKSWFTVILFSFYIQTLAQNSTIIGRISDENAALGFATIKLEPLQKGMNTDKNGNFRFENLPPGDYALLASYIGFLPKKQKISLQAGETVELNFQLEPSLSLGEVVVTGTMKSTHITQSPIKIEVVSSEQMELFMPAAASSLIEGVQLLNGVQEVVACGVCYTNSISINGLPGPYTAVLMDGTPMYGNLASVYGLNGIPNMIIDRFEVIKGPSSTLYGSEAVAGVINIITKDPEEQPLFSADVMGTTHSESFGNFAIAPKIGQSTGYIGLNYAYVNDYDDINQDGFGDAINLDRISLFSKWNIHRKSGKKFTLSGKYYYEDRRNGVEAFLKDRAYRTLRGNEQIYGESIYTNRMELFGTYEFNTHPNLKLDFSLSDHRQDSYYGSDYYKADQQIAFGNFLWNVEQGQHDVLVGLTARYQAYDDNTVATEFLNGENQLVNRPDNQFIPGLFVQDEFQASEQWTLLGGARFDHYDSHGLIFAPRLNVKYKPSDWTTFRSNFGTGFRIVNLFTEDHAFVTGQRSVEILESLNPEQSYNASLNFNHVYTLGGGSGYLDIDAYFTHFTNKIIPDYDTPGKIIYANSTGFARSMGIGMSVNHNFSFPLGVNLGFNLQRATETEENEAGIVETRNIEFAPQYTGVFSANYSWRSQNITFAYTAQLTGVMELPEVFDLGPDGLPVATPRSTQSEPFSLHNFQVTKTFDQAPFTLYGGMQNIFNYRQLSSPLIGFNDPNAAIGFSEFFDTSYAYAPNHGREFYVGIRWDVGRRK